MLRTTFRSLWSHKRRLVSTCIAIVLGVAFMAGTLVLTSTINRIFDDIFANLNENTDAIVRGDVLFKNHHTGSQRARLPESLVAKVGAVRGVKAVAPTLTNTTLTLLDKNGEPMGGQGPPTFVASWTDNKDLNSYQVASGRAPAAMGEAIIDRATADAGPFKIGDTLVLIAPVGREKLKLVGTSRFGNADSSGGLIAIGTTLEQAQTFAGEPNRLDTIDVKAVPGITPSQLVARLTEANLGPKVDVVTGRQAADETASEIKSAFAFFSTILLVFAAVALFVGMFIISNTFGILIAQRTRELALLRALGATRRQVLGSVLVEAGVVGLVSALLGFLVGVGLAFVAFWGLRKGGIDLPSAGLAVTPSAALTAIIVGVAVTGAAAVVPAIRATRVPPIAALRDVAIDTSGNSVGRAAVGFMMLVLGGIAVIPAFAADPTSESLPRVGVGLALILGAVLVLGPVIARPLSTIVGAPLPLIKGVTGRLARENAMRSPRRTASTASALIIGVTLVGFITVFASSAQTSITSSVSGGFRGDFIIQPITFGGATGGLPPKVADDLRKVDGVDQVASIRSTIGQVKLPRDRTATDFIAGIDPEAFQKVFKISMTVGRFGPLTADEMVVDRELARTKHLKVGDKITVIAAGDKTANFRIVGIGDDLAILSLFGQQFVTSNEGFAKLSSTPTDFLSGITLDRSTSPEKVRPALKAELEPYPTMKLQDRDQFTGSLVAQIKALLNVIYALLAVSIIIALIGIANTLSLSINERTRELGLLRAMGMSRSQLRSTVRWEAVIVALMGTGLGVILGLGLSWILVKALVSQGITTFSVPLTGLIIEVVFGAVLGIAASLRPAAKAAKLNVLQAIATE